MKELNCEDRRFYYEKNFFTLDGLWIIETENETDFETALKIDLLVWRKLLKIIYKRIAKYIKADTSRVDHIIDIMAFRWTCENWEFDIPSSDENEGEIIIKKCPYREIMERNPDRKPLIPRICNEICKPIYKEAIHSLNPEVQVIREKFQGLSDPICDFTLKVNYT